MSAPTNRQYRRVPQNPRRTTINVTNSGGAGQTLELLAAVPAQPIIVWGGELYLSASTTVDFQSGGNSLTGPLPALLVSRDMPTGNLDHVINAQAWKETNAGEAFNAVVGANVTITGELIWSIPGDN